jgi:hypothetical protein
VADVPITFPAESVPSLACFPDQRYGISLSQWDDFAVEAIEQSAPNLGRYDVTLDDTYRYWMVFEGLIQTQPTDWNQWIDVIDLMNLSISDLIETTGGTPRFKQSALAQVVRWVSGPVLPNEPYPPARRLGTRDLTLFNGEDLSPIIPLEHLDDETLSTIENEELLFTVETSRKVVLLSELFTVENGSIQVTSTAAITEKKQNLQWSLRWPDNTYITGGRITVAYAPIAQQ